MGDGRLQRFLEGLKKAGGLQPGHSTAGSGRTDRGLKEGFLRINIPHSGQQALVHEQRMNTRRSFFNDSHKFIPPEFREGVRSQGGLGMPGIRRGQKPHLSESPLVMKRQAFAAGKPDHHSGVLEARTAVRPDNQLSGHPKMKPDAPLIGQLDPEVFPLSLEGLPGLSRKNFVPARFLPGTH